MGYQNGSRPDDAEKLLGDVDADLNGLYDDVDTNPNIPFLDGVRLLSSIRFIRDSVRQLRRQNAEKTKAEAQQKLRQLPRTIGD